jgi:signal transduction histidine kinase/CheY-like chemotaxis protein
MRKIRLRTKFLLSLICISAGLTAATLLIVSYSVEARIRENIREDLRTAVNTYASFEKQRESDLARSAQLLANLPNVRALMTTEDVATIQDASADVWRLSGKDMLVLAGRNGDLASLKTSVVGLDRDKARELLRASLERGDSGAWWFGGGHLYEVWIQPIYFGSPAQSTTFGYLAVGDEVDQHAAIDFGKIASSEICFSFGDEPVAGTLAPNQQWNLQTRLSRGNGTLSTDTQEIQLGPEHFLETTVRLSPAEGSPVFLTVLKSIDKATVFLTHLNNDLVGLGFLSIVAGSALVFLISHTFTRPLSSLVTGVRALQEGNFNYPLESRGGDEVTEVTAAFIHMRANLKATQEEQKQLEERLRQSHKMEAVGRLAGGVAHDFNNLLTIIRGNSDLLIDREGADDFHRRCIEQIQKASGRAVSMTRQLLAFSRMQVLQPQMLDLNSIVADMGKMLPRLIGEHIEYKFTAGEKLATVKADAGQIEQVILNLAVNARDAMPGGGTLTVSTHNIVVTESEALKRPPMTAGRFVLLSVTDSGHGIDDATKIHIFEPFFTTKEVGKGTGLGLATVYGVVKQSGGFIWVESTVGKGTTFEVYLPEVEGSSSKPSAEMKPRAIPRGSETVLVVEDEEGVRQLACQFLRVKGYTVLEAGGGEEALEIAGKYPGPIHALLSDMVMPKMNGGVLAGKLKAIRPEIKIAFMSGYAEYSRGDSAQAVPEAPVLQKPFSPASLLGIVREALTGIAGTRESNIEKPDVPKEDRITSSITEKV